MWVMAVESSEMVVLSELMHCVRVRINLQTVADGVSCVLSVFTRKLTGQLVLTLLLSRTPFRGY